MQLHRIVLAGLGGPCGPEESAKEECGDALPIGGDKVSGLDSRGVSSRLFGSIL